MYLINKYNTNILCIPNLNPIRIVHTSYALQMSQLYTKLSWNHCHPIQLKAFKSQNELNPWMCYVTPE